MTAVVIIEAAVIVLLVVLVAGLLNSHAEILRRLERLDGGDPDAGLRSRQRTTGLGQTPSAEITGVEPAGGAASVSLRHGQGETLLAFLSSGCASCRTFWEELSGSAPMPTPNTRPVIVTKGPASESPSKIADLAPHGIRLIMSDEAWDDFRVPLTPYFMLVDGAGGILGEGSASNMGHLEGLFHQAARDASPARLNTKGRQKMTDRALHESGIEPGDQSLYEDPLRE